MALYHEKKQKKCKNTLKNNSSKIQGGAKIVNMSTRHKKIETQALGSYSDVLMRF